MTAHFENPAKLFLRNHKVESLVDVIAYTEFLRNESELTSNPPINLQKIIDHFGIRTPQAACLPQQEGTTITIHGSPLILFNSEDIPTRQKFTIAHELIELLITEISDGIRPDRVKRTIFGMKSEQICQKGSANLLMPRESFLPRAKGLGLLFQSAEILADEYEVSLMAALCRLLDMYPKQGMLILWQMKNKPTELKKEVLSNQIPLPGIRPTNNLPPPKLRAMWTYGDYMNNFMPKDKSISEDSSVYDARNYNQFTSGEELIPFGSYNVKAFIESKPININGERHVLSLVR